MKKPLMCIHTYCSRCNEETDHTLNDECEYNFYYHCDHCDNTVIISKEE